MGNIVLLDDLTINQIAAGEVIERPASVVKELVENAIDAGATVINVEIKNGGISYIHVTDNGKGILPDDMEIAFERHATSKIRSAQDLDTVKSMGFRGEALASIASIAKVTMQSKTRVNDIGYAITVEGGNVIEKREAGCPNGTTITVENLFYNTPVRYKFLKKDFTEAGYIEDVMTRIALVNPNIAIKLISGGKTVIQTSGNGDVKIVIYNIYGKEVAENLLEVDYTYEDIHVKGVVGKPAIARSNRSNQLFFVNQRYIKDKTLTSAAEQAFKGMITIGKFGFLVLNLEMNPQKVDVNVHPTKLEVRFEEESKVFKAVYHAIKETLLKADLVSNSERDYSKESNEKAVEINAYTPTNPMQGIPEQKEEKLGLFQRFRVKRDNPMEVETNNVLEKVYQDRQQKEKTDFVLDGQMPEKTNNVELIQKPNIDNFVPKPNITDTLIVDTNAVKQELEQKMQNQDTQVVNVKEVLEKEQTQKIDVEAIQEASKEIENVPKPEESLAAPKEEVDFEKMYSSIFGSNPKKENKQGNAVQEETGAYLLKDAMPKQVENVSLFEGREENKRPAYKFIGIAFSTYILIEMGNELYMIDQHAAHERIMYEKVRANYYNDTDKDSQLMLLPDIITLTHKEMGIAKDNIEMFEKAGFVLEEFGENTIKLTGVPNICIDLDTRQLFLETLDEINTVARTAKQEIEEKFLATVACKAAVKAHMALTKEEVESLLDSLLVLPNPFTCPHGRPTAIRMTKNDIERKFERRK